MSQTNIISSDGQKNIVFEKNIIEKDKMKIRIFFADFISPHVSRIHQIDPMIDKINFNKFIR